ncbi:MAG: class I adenylate-forming enzyme family protein [Bryobacteraceae bacterium]
MCTAEVYERDPRHLLHEVVSKWARERPGDPALVGHGREGAISWREFEAGSAAVSASLAGMGFRRGDFLAASLPFVPETVLLEYACFRIGVIFAPLDLRLAPAEVARGIQTLGARGYVFPSRLRELGAAMRTHCEHTVELEQGFPPPRPQDVEAARRLSAEVAENDAALVIFTTGSTGAPKAALLSHRNITCQNMCLGGAFAFREGMRVLVNLPASHVGGQTELLMTTLFFGGTAVLLDIFDAARSLEAIARHRVNLIGQIPAMFQLEWRLSSYGGSDLSSLESAIYGGQQVPAPFLEKLAAMAPHIGTGLGLTEAAGFCTYTRRGATPEDIASSIGFDMPVYPMSIREPMDAGGRAGRELPGGEIGNICFRGPQTFLGYVHDPEATARTISRDGWLYTGDLGYRDAQGLHLCGRSKWVIKPRGYQVFPSDVENHLCALPDVANAGVVGVEHAVHSEAIVAFVEPKPGATLDVAELKRHARGMASYMRPLHYVVLQPGGLPLNRVAKVDYLRLSEMASAEVNHLRAQRRWDR